MILIYAFLLQSGKFFVSPLVLSLIHIQMCIRDRHKDNMLNLRIFNNFGIRRVTLSAKMGLDMDQWEFFTFGCMNTKGVCINPKTDADQPKSDATPRESSVRIHRVKNVSSATVIAAKLTSESNLGQVRWNVNIKT